jgi:hypothetical protein
LEDYSMVAYAILAGIALAVMMLGAAAYRSEHRH